MKSTSFSLFQRRTPRCYVDRKKVGWFLLLATSGLTLPVWGQPLSLNQVVEQSVHQYPFLQAKQAEISSAQQRLKASQVEFLPSVLVQDQYTYATSNSLNGSFFPNE